MRAAGMQRRRAAMVFVAGTALLAGCNFPSQRAVTPDLFGTAAAQTVAAQLTQSAGQQPTAPESQTPSVSTNTPIPTDTPIPATETPGGKGCSDKAAFVSDVTIPDDTNVAPGASFKKTWRLRNDGTCTWTTEYDLVFDSGNIMGGPASVPLAGSVAPGSTVDVSVDLKAPTTNGTYQGNWMLRNEEDVLFGLGPNADKSFFVRIVVGPTATPKPSIAYNMGDKYCDAQWVGSPPGGPGTVLSCPGSDTDSQGFVIRVANPKLENGTTENEPALWTHPAWVDDGVISGLYPSFDVKAGDHFVAYIGCLYNGTACNVKFQLNYKEGSTLYNLGEWTETYDGSIHLVNVDLSTLAGKSVQFALVVLANGASNQDWAFWLVPRIVR